MNEAPEKIWLDSEGAAWEHYSEEDTLYIRADIFDELAEALKYVMIAHGEQLSDAFEKAQNVLAKLEEK
jgi:hypothetical protein